LAQGADPDGSELVWTTSYDAAGNTVKSTDPDTGTTVSSYNDDNELVSSTDNAGQTLSTDYDVLGRKTAVHNGDTSGPILNAWAYDNADGGKGRLASATAYAADGVTPTWTHSVGGYNAFGKPTAETTTVPAGAYGNTAAISYATTASYTPIMGNVDTTTIKETGTGNLIGTESYGIGYNDAGLPVATGGLDTYVAWADYDPHGRLLRATDSVMPKQMVVTNSWDEPTGRLLNSTVSKEDGNAAVDSTSYTYNPAGQITSATDTQDGGGAASTDRQCFGYDYLGRLTNAWTDAGTTHTAPTPSVQGIGGCDATDPSMSSLSGPAPYWQSYAYDLTGNRLSSTDHAITPGGADRTTTETYDGLEAQHAVHTV
jgi:YD repeat-containing protein